MTHNADRSLDFVAAQGKVSGFEAPQEADFVHDRSETVMQVEEQRIVTQNKDKFGMANEEPQGNADSYVPDETSQPAAAPDPFEDPNDDDDAILGMNDEQTKQEYNDFFGDIEEQPPAAPEEESKNNEPSILSVWQEERREILRKKADDERQALEDNRLQGQKDLEEFNAKRQERIEQARKNAQAREADLRGDYQSVFEHGTIWQQVAKLVDLQSKDPRVERMKNLIIELKNQDDKIKT